MSEQGILYYFTNAYPFGMGESWKKNELEVFSKYFSKIVVVPFSYDGNTNPKRLPENASAVSPVSESRTGYPAIFRAIFFSSIFREAIREFFSEKVFLSVARAKEFIGTLFLIGRLYNHEIFRELRKHRDKSVTLYFFWGTGLSYSLVFLKKENFRRIVVRFHGIDLYAERHISLYIPFRNRQLKQLDLAAPISESGKRYLLTTRKDIAFDCDVYRLGCVSVGRAHQSSDGIFRIATCSTIIPLKRLDLVAKALAHVHFPVHWLHIGDGPLRTELDSLVEKLPANISVTFAGKVDPDRLLDYYAGKPIDLFINVSQSEGVPVSIMEAFSAGIPVMATNVGGTPEIVNPEVGVLLSPDVTSHQLAEEMSRFNALGTDAKSRLRDRCYEQYMLNCNAHSWAERMVKKLI